MDFIFADGHPHGNPLFGIDNAATEKTETT
jgi:hypothetical protein